MIAGLPSLDQGLYVQTEALGEAKVDLEEIDGEEEARGEEHLSPGPMGPRAHSLGLDVAPLSLECSG